MPVCEPENRNDPLNVGFGLTFTCSKLNSKPALNVCAPQTLDTLSFRAYVLFACFKFVIGVPMTKELKMMFSTPSIEGVENIIFNSFVMGTPITNLKQANNTYALNDNVSRVWGAHTFKAGFELSFEQLNVNPNPTFNGSFLLSGSQTGIDFADFLIGVASNYNQADSQAYYIRHKYFGGFAQDSWRATSTLTLNYGLRWDRL